MPPHWPKVTTREEAAVPPFGQTTRPARPARWAHSLAVVGLLWVLLDGAGTLAEPVKLGVLLLASVIALDLARRESRDPGSPVPIACSIAMLFAVAVIYPPRFAHDLWSYALVGRIVVVHHASPYLHAASSYPTDPFLSLVRSGWRNGTTPYGPLFTLQASVVALVGGSHPLLYRLLFQSSAAAAIGVALLVLWRATGSTSALALLGLHPAIACSVVNGGHNDALIGLGLLLAVVNARKERFARAGCWIAAALLVKATAGLALFPLAGWAWVRRRWRGVGEISMAPLLVAAPAMLLIPGVMRSLTSAKTNVITRASVWNLPFRILPRLFPNAPHPTAAVLVSLGLAVVVLLVGATAWLTRKAPDPALGVVLATSIWLVFGAYVLAWYTVWALPTAALRTRSRLTWLVAMQGVAITWVYVVPRASLVEHSLAGDAVQLILPSLLVAMFAWAMVPVLRNEV